LRRAATFAVRAPLILLTAAPLPFQDGKCGCGWLQIIGVVGDSRDDGLDKPVAPAVYVPYTLVTAQFTDVLIRTQGEPLALLHGIKEKIASIDPDQETADDIRDLEGWIQREPEYSRARLISMLFGAFSILALTLAAVGLYSVVSYTVLQRISELGVRVAHGARRRDVPRLVAFVGRNQRGLGNSRRSCTQPWSESSHCPLDREWNA
jgi:putative ABC transport system permease protein